MNFIILLPFLLLTCINIMAQNKNTVFINGTVYTVDANNSIQQAVVISQNKIDFVGSTEQAKKYITSESRVIDLHGKLMLPGFIDDHVHFTTGGFYLTGIDLRGAKSTKEFIALVQKYSSTRAGQWITGGDWDHEAWEKNDYPVKEWIDSFTQNTPVFISRFDGHCGLANSYALKLAGIDKNTPDPAGGKIEHDPLTGEPTGLLKDNAMNAVFNLIPSPSEQQTYDAALVAMEHASKLGVTSVHDITLKNDFVVYQRLLKENRLTLRIYTRLPIDGYQSLSEMGAQVNFGDPNLKIGSLKAFADGSLGSSTAWFFDKYKQDTTTCGLPMDIVTDGRLEKWAFDADLKHLQLSIHAIGDKANNCILNLYENISKKNPKWDRRFRIEHAQHINKSDIARFSKLNVIASVQPYHCIDDGVWAEKRIGKERIKEVYPFKSFLESGVKLCFGSDWTVAPINPLLGIYAAVTRSTLDGKNPNGWVPEQKISVEDAIRCYTINNAYAAFQENELGSIEVGKYADLVVLDRDILKIEKEKIKDTKVLITVADGKIVYEPK